MLRIGCHLSSSKGYLAMAKTAVSIDANTFQFFTRNPRGSRAKSLDPKDIEAFLTFAKEHDISQIGIFIDSIDQFLKRLCMF